MDVFLGMWLKHMPFRSFTVLLPQISNFLIFSDALNEILIVFHFSLQMREQFQTSRSGMDDNCGYELDITDMSWLPGT